jgi:hypothetical protein
MLMSFAFPKWGVVIIEPLLASALGLKDLSNIPELASAGVSGVSFGRIDQANPIIQNESVDDGQLHSFVGNYWMPPPSRGTTDSNVV